MLLFSEGSFRLTAFISIVDCPTCSTIFLCFQVGVLGRFELQELS